MHNENIYEVLFRAWHDEAYLYINQAITQEKPNIDRKDVALMMYQKGLGLLDLALCVDTEVGRNLDNPNEDSCRHVMLRARARAQLVRRRGRCSRRWGRLGFMWSPESRQ